MARRIHRPDAVRVVENACLSNHLSLLIPFHRVIGTDGTLSGYRWCINRNGKLLENEVRCLYDT
ncbi:MGMT family protein [Candidatus Williamhamiltonella defendens]|uniref:MGMT family protein n=1 Tax=Candidatus Williamhamiltonella defendens TaxID=138072 RepID=UPI001F227565|nr:MGMT family protein [Candidatus Hamiltonella defensa]